MRHHYTTRTWMKSTYKFEVESARATCTKTYLPWEKDDNWTSVPHKATCPSCLKVLIKIADEKLQQMKKNLERAEATLQ